MSEKINVVWFKRDLRLKDHAPLYYASEADLPLLLVYFIEHSLVTAPQSDDRHWRFIWQSLEELYKSLIPYGGETQIIHQEVIPYLEKLRSRYRVNAVYSHQETGIKITYVRDKAVQSFLCKYGIDWFEYKSHGVSRGRIDRKGWSKEWYSFMIQPTLEPQNADRSDWDKQD